MTTTNPLEPLDEEPQGDLVEAGPEPETGSDEPTHHLKPTQTASPETAVPEVAADLVPEDEGGQAAGSSPGSLPVAPAETEEVYVILPDEEVGAIPVLETEAVEGQGGVPAAAPVFFERPTEGVDAQGVEAAATSESDPAALAGTESLPSFEGDQGSFSVGTGEPGELGLQPEIGGQIQAREAPLPETGEVPASGSGSQAELDQIASELDEEVLSGEGEGSAGEPLPLLEAMEGESARLDSLEDGEQTEVFEGESGAPAAGHHRRFRVLLATAAILAITVAGVYFGYTRWMGHRERSVEVAAVTPAGAQPATDTSPPGKDPSAAPPADGTGPAPTPTEPPGGGAPSAGATTAVPSPAAEDPAALARAAFREKFLLAIQLGFVGEVGHE